MEETESWYWFLFFLNDSAKVGNWILGEFKAILTVYQQTKKMKNILPAYKYWKDLMTDQVHKN